MAAVRIEPADAAQILRSLEIAARLGGDLTGAVYALLFERQPQMLALFGRDTDGAIKGEMLARVFEAIIDFVGERRYAHRLIQTEVVNHEGFDVPRETFSTFFPIVAETVRAACAEVWTLDMEAAWSRLLAALDYYVQHPDQSLG